MKAFSNDINRLFMVPLLVVGLTVDIFFLIDGQYLFGTQFAAYQSDIALYVAMDALLIGVIGKTPEIQISFMDAMIYFTPTFIVTSIVIGEWYSVYYAGATPTFTFQSYLAQILYQIFGVALSEELLFRGLLIKYTGWVGQGILFGLFHLEAYNVEGFTWTTIFVAMIFGIFMGYIVHIATKMGYPAKGLAVTWGFHAAYNVSIILNVFNLGAVI
jgi:membrane protease YdiL (CAAX protease family)